MLFRLLFEQPLVFLVVAVALIISLTIHEFAHAYASHKLGDDTARLLGRLTLNPKAHIDPIGLALLLFVGFGWGKPVPFNPINLKNPKRDSAIIAVAGPLSNFLLASILTIIFHTLANGNIIGILLYPVIFYNIVLGVFNLIPIHPLDGYTVVSGFLPPSLYYQWLQIQNYGSIILLILVITGSTSVIISPIINFFMSLYGL